MYSNAATFTLDGVCELEFSSVQFMCCGRRLQVSVVDGAWFADVDARLRGSLVGPSL